ncbi:MAG: hypothetical protein KTR24_10915 [Saprospiraceae bacterium]|nr:hypothetical protein [Saprospiraceae bacterium]
MPISTTDQIFKLVKSLTKAEKRNFKLYAKRTQQQQEARFIRLFDVLDKMNEYDEQLVFKGFSKLSKGQLSNLKRHLYSQILSSLRMIHIKKEIDIQIREQMDFARILYGKGLYMQSLKLLERIKGIAKSSNQDILHYEILEFEKLIEEKHITRSRKIENKVENLIEESAERSRILSMSNRLTNLKLRIHGLYIKIGHVKNEKGAIVVKDYFKASLADFDQSNLTFFEKVYLHQSYVWFYYILLDFENCFEHAKSWVDLFEERPTMISEDPDTYLRGLHYCLTSLFTLKRPDIHEEYLSSMRKFYDEQEASLNTTSRMIYFLYYSSAFMNSHYLYGTFSDGLVGLPALRSQLRKYSMLLDQHRILVFRYRVAWMHFGCGNFDEAIDSLNLIINLKVGHLREDIQSYARLLHLMAHFEIGNYSLMEYLEKSVSRFFDKMENRNQVQVELLSYIRKQIRSGSLPNQKLLQETRDKLQKLLDDPYEIRSFIYMDSLAWIESRINNCHVQDIIQRRNAEIAEAGVDQ